jgi:GntR family transcriptional regulator/MocR family aminotransferase
MTVTVAYERLLAEGLVTARVGAGTFVSDRVPRAATLHDTPTVGAIRGRATWDSVPLPSAFARPARYDFRTGLPDASLFPHRAWRRLVSQSMRAAEAAAGIYQQPAGLSELRGAIARHVAISRGVAARPGNVTITNGTQQALDILARVLLAPGDAIAVEDPGYEPPRRLFASLGLRVIGVRVDADGLVVSALPSGIRAAYVTPSHQYPLGMAMTPRRRAALLEWAERNGAAIIEDDYDSEFRFGGRPLQALQTLDEHGRVIYVGTFSCGGGRSHNARFCQPGGRSSGLSSRSSGLSSGTGNVFADLGFPMPQSARPSYGWPMP